MMSVDEEACEFAGLDIKRVKSVVRRLSSAMRDADRMGLFLFGGSGHGTLRKEMDGHPIFSTLIIADIDGCVDGGDGAATFDDRGLQWGETQHHS